MSRPRWYVDPLSLLFRSRSRSLSLALSLLRYCFISAFNIHCQSSPNLTRPPFLHFALSLASFFHRRVQVKDEETLKKLLIEHLTNPVLWHKSVQLALDLGCRSFAEVGPGKVLSTLLQRMKRSDRELRSSLAVR